MPIYLTSLASRLPISFTASVSPMVMMVREGEHVKYSRAIMKPASYFWFSLYIHLSHFTNTNNTSVKMHELLLTTFYIFHMKKH